MQPLLTSEQMRQADAEATGAFAVPEILLIEHAGLALVQHLEKRFHKLLKDTRGLILAGTGNNGADVLAAARLLWERGCQNLFVVLVGSDRTLSKGMQQELELLGRLGIAWGRELDEPLLDACDWVLDGIFGSGLSRAVDGEQKDRIELLNRVAGKKWIVSADIPSGLSGDTGNPQPIAVRASATVTFGFYKRGLVTGEAAHYVGELSLAPVQIPRSVDSHTWESFLYTEEDAARLPLRRKDSHKGNFGRVALIAGPANKEGAAGLSALGSLRSGAGLVTIFASKETLGSLRPRLVPEVMTEEFSIKTLASIPEASVCVGPGLGTDEAAWQILKACLDRRSPLVLDADALTLLTTYTDEAMKRLAARWDVSTVLTPHPKEAALLLGCSTEEIQKDRYASARALADKWKCGVILKGSGSLCTAPGSPLVAVRAGDSGLSKGGTGDVLAGILAGLFAQGLTLAQAMPLAVYIHGRASERLSERVGHSRSSLASEVAEEVASVLKELECHPGR